MWIGPGEVSPEQMRANKEAHDAAGCRVVCIAISRIPRYVNVQGFWAKGQAGILAKWPWKPLQGEHTAFSHNWSAAYDAAFEWCEKEGYFVRGIEE